MDEGLYQEEQRDYLERVAEERFGILSVLTYLPRSTSAQQAFEYFKTRNEVEQMIDVFTNILRADRSYMRTPQLLYYQLFKELTSLGLLFRYSPAEVLQYLDRVYKVKANNQWRTAEIPKRTRIILEKLKLRIP